jgi:IS30 family transposase
MPKGKCKMSKVTDKEMFEMLGMFISGKSVTEISKATGRSKPTVEKYISELKAEQKESGTYDAEETEPEPEAPKSNRKNTTQFIRKTGEKKIKGVSIMTGAESARGEASSRHAGAKNPKYLSTIHKINED